MTEPPETHGPGGSTLWGRFEAVTRRAPSHPAILTAAGALSYGELLDRSERVAGALHDCGIGRGCRVALALTEPEDMIMGILGALRIGAAYVPVDPSYPAARRQSMLLRSTPTLLLTDQRPDASTPVEFMAFTQACAGPKVSSAVGPRASDISSVLFTSGSTGRVKGVLQTHRTILFHIDALTERFDIRPRDRHSLVASLSFDASTTDVFTTLLNGATLVPINVRRDGLAHLAQRLVEHEVTLFHSTPTVFRHLAESDLRTSKLRLVLLGGEPVIASDIARFTSNFRVGCELVNGYGTTETAGFLSLNTLVDASSGGRQAAPPAAAFLASTGSAIAGVELQLRDPISGEPCRGRGELVARSHFLGVGYLDDDDATRRTFRHIRGNGEDYHLYFSGDLAIEHPTAGLVLAGRADRQVKLRGYRIDPTEVESTLCMTAGVAGAAVVVASTAERLVAFVRPEVGSNVDVTHLRAQAATQLPSYTVPDLVVALDAFPLTPTGKTDLDKLSELASVMGPSGSPDSEPSAGHSTHLTTYELLVAGAWSRVLQQDRMPVDVNFFDVGGTSLLMARLHGELESLTHRPFPFHRLFEFPTVRAMARLIAQLKVDHDLPAGPTSDPAAPDGDRAGRRTAGLDRARRRRQAGTRPAAHPD